MKFLTLISVIFLQQVGVYAKWGGNDIFTSLNALHRFWEEERAFVQKLEDSIDTFESVITSMRRYVDNHKRLKLNQEPNYKYLGNPLNGYLLIRHSAMGWNHFSENVVPQLNKTIPDLQYITNRSELVDLADLDDVSGAAYGIARLHSLYNLKTDKLVNDGVVETNLHEKHILSEPSVKKLSAWDLHLLSVQSKSNGLMASSVDIYPHAIEQLQLENEVVTDDSKILDLFDQEGLNVTEVTDDYQLTIKYHDQYLLRHGCRSQGLKMHRLPIDKEIRKKEKKKILKREKKNQREIVREDPLEEKDNVDHYERERVSFRVDLQKEDLCAGHTFRNATEDKDLHCFYAHNDSPWLKLAPIKVELKSFDPYVAVFRELMLPHECDSITEYLGPLLGPPPGRMSNKGAAKNDWTMKNAWPVEEDNYALEKMTRRVEHITTLKASSSKGESDRFMCGNYGIGGHYGVHPDFYAYGNQQCDNINRVATVMTVLEAPEAGGATVFPFLGVSVFPEKGSGIMWFNTRSDSVPDYETKHAACPVLLGQKWIGNKWIGYKPQWLNRQCHLEPRTRYMGPLK